MPDFSGLPLVIEPSDLLGRLDAEHMILVDLTSVARYAEGHIPGARFVDPKRTQLGQTPAPGLLPSKASLEALFGELGHTPDATYVVYDDEGGGWAGRFIWMLDVIVVSAPGVNFENSELGEIDYPLFRVNGKEKMRF